MAKTRIVVVVKGGAVAEVLSDAKGVEVYVKDLDVDGRDDLVLGPDGKPCAYDVPDVVVSKKTVDAEAKAVEAAVDAACEE